MTILYTGNSTLPWWGFIVAMIIGYVFLTFFGAMQAITGIQWLVQPIVQMIGGYIQPGNPVANMYFSLYVSCPNPPTTLILVYFFPYSNINDAGLQRLNPRPASIPRP
jgi:hypothetical protein